MDIARIGVVIWLTLPVMTYAAFRYRRNDQLRKYPAFTTGKVVEAIWKPGYGEDNPGYTSISYRYILSGNEHTGQGEISGGGLKPGDEIQIRYDPAQPQVSILWRPTTRTTWVTLGLVWLAISTGYAGVAIMLGLFFISFAVRLALRHSASLKSTSLAKIIIAIIVLTLLGLPFVVAGFSVLIQDGFLAQNILWALWNHQPL